MFADSEQRGDGLMLCSRGWFQTPLVLRLCLRQEVDATMPSTSAEKHSISLRGLRGNLETSDELHNQTTLSATSALAAGEENIDEECGRSMMICECVVHLTIVQVTS